MELQPLKITNRFATNIFFHNKIDDKLYIFKCAFKQSKLRMFGTFRTLHVEEKDLICKGTLNELNSDKSLIIQPLTNSPNQ